ncbi:MAG: HAD-IIIC family phosphatase [Prevotella sp.]|nr:HAD-IIIC family phosphatase [Prevotella sp.]
MAEDLNKVKKLVVDLDDTISVTEKGDYQNSKPIQETIDLLRKYKEEGFLIVIHSSRQMRTYEGQVGKINVHTLPNIVNWLNRYQVPYDEIIVGKPWCGFTGFYIDDKSIRPSEFHSMSLEQIDEMLKKEKEYIRSLVK